MRILHLGDVHLRLWDNLDDTLQALEQVRTIIREERVDLVVLPGDLYHAETCPAERALAAEEVSKIAELCDLLVVKGNHDEARDLWPLGLCPGVTVLERPEVVPVYGRGEPGGAGAVLVVGVPWPERGHLAAAGFTGEGGHQAGQAALSDMLRGLAAQAASWDLPVVVAGHLSVVGALSSSGQPMVGREIQALEQDLVDTGAAAVCLNHIHRPQGFYAGSLTVQDHGEEEEEKSVRLITVERGRPADVRLVPISCRRWLTVEAGVVDGKVVDSVGSLQELRGANVRYRYTCAPEEEALFDRRELGRRFESCHALRVEGKVDRRERVRAAEVAQARTLEDKLRAWAEVTGAPVTPGVLDKLARLQSGREG